MWPYGLSRFLLRVRPFLGVYNHWMPRIRDWSSTSPHRKMVPLSKLLAGKPTNCSQLPSPTTTSSLFDTQGAVTFNTYRK